MGGFAPVNSSAEKQQPAFVSGAVCSTRGYCMLMERAYSIAMQISSIPA